MIESLKKKVFSIYYVHNHELEWDRFDRGILIRAKAQGIIQGTNYCYSATSIIRTSQRPHYHACAEGVTDDLFVGVVIDWAMSYGLYRLALAKIDLPKYFSEHCWPWSCWIGIVYTARYHKPGEKCRHFSYLDISLIRYGSNRPVDKGVRIIEVALYCIIIWCTPSCIATCTQPFIVQR